MMLTIDRDHKPAWYLKKLEREKNLEIHEWPCGGTLRVFPRQDGYDDFTPILMCNKCGEAVREE